MHKRVHSAYLGMTLLCVSQYMTLSALFLLEDHQQVFLLVPWFLKSYLGSGPSMS